MTVVDGGGGEGAYDCGNVEAAVAALSQPKLMPAGRGQRSAEMVRTDRKRGARCVTPVLFQRAGSPRRWEVGMQQQVPASRHLTLARECKQK